MHTYMTMLCSTQKRFWTRRLFAGQSIASVWIKTHSCVACKAIERTTNICGHVIFTTIWFLPFYQNITKDHFFRTDFFSAPNFFLLWLNGYFFLVSQLVFMLNDMTISNKMLRWGTIKVSACSTDAHFFKAPFGSLFITSFCKEEFQVF